MATIVDDTIKKLRPFQRKKVEARAAELLAEEMGLRELRHARKLTQVRKAKKLGITQDSVASRTAKRSLTVDAQKDDRSYGRESISCRPISRPAVGGAIGYCGK